MNSDSNDLESLVKGNSEAWTLFLEKYESRINQAIRSKLRGLPARWGSANDVVGSSIRTLIRQFSEDSGPNFDTTDDVFKWLITTSLFKAARQWRRAKATKRGGLRVKAVSEVEREESNILDSFCGQDQNEDDYIALTIQKLEDKLGELDDEQKQIVSLLFAGHSQVEVSKQLECSTKTIERKLKIVREIWSEDQ